MKTLLQTLDDVSRRDFVTYCARSLLGLGMLSLAPKGGAAALAAPSPTRGLAKAKGKNVIYLYMSGGMSHLDTFDPKPGQDVAGPVSPINTNADGIRISQYLPNLARQMDKAAVINSLTSTQGAHEQGNYFMHTAYQKRGTIRHPGLGTWMLKLSGRTNPTLPGNVLIGGSATDATSGFMEAAYAPVPIGNPGAGLQNSTPPEGLDEKAIRHRLKLADQFDQAFKRKYDQQQVRAYADMYDDALTLMKSKDLAAFDISKEKDRTRQTYGTNSFGQGCLLARRLVEHDVRFVEVVLGGWDTHIDNFDAVESRAAVLDRALAALLEDLGARGMLDNTLVVLATEFGRTPTINMNNGRDHFPRAFSCLLAGAGVKGGQVYGKTNEIGTAVAENPVTIPNFNATIAHVIGLPLDKIIYSPSRRPFTVADKGEPIEAIF